MHLDTDAGHATNDTDGPNRETTTLIYRCCNGLLGPAPTLGASRRNRPATRLNRQQVQPKRHFVLFWGHFGAPETASKQAALMPALNLKQQHWPFEINTPKRAATGNSGCYLSVLAVPVVVVVVVVVGF